MHMHAGNPSADIPLLLPLPLKPSATYAAAAAQVAAPNKVGVWYADSFTSTFTSCTDILDLPFATIAVMAYRPANVVKQ